MLTSLVSIPEGGREIRFVAKLLKYLTRAPSLEFIAVPATWFAMRGATALSYCCSRSTPFDRQLVPPLHLELLFNARILCSAPLHATAPRPCPHASSAPPCPHARRFTLLGTLLPQPCPISCDVVCRTPHKRSLNWRPPLQLIG